MTKKKNSKRSFSIAMSLLMTLSLIAPGVVSAETTSKLHQSVNNTNLMAKDKLEPYYTYPGGEIGYDDGTAEGAHVFYAAGNARAVKMSLPEGKENGLVTDGVFLFGDTEWPVPGGTEFAVEVWDATGAGGTPGKKLAGPIDATALRNGEWTVVDLTEHNIVVNGDFYMVYRQTFANPNTPALAIDVNGTNAKRSYESVSGTWSALPAADGNYMIRARVSHEVNAPVITSPTDDLATNDPAITIEGTASPTTTIQLKNNGEAAGSVVVGDDGKFAIQTELTEGTNEFTAISKLDGRVTGESAPVSVILDTVKPNLTIDSPRDGDRTNRETVIVEGSVEDANLDWIKVNGQNTAVVNGKYSKRILLDTGSNKITVVARDKANNSISKTVTVTAKYVAPVVENVLPNQDVNLKTGKSVKIEFDSEPGLKSTFVIHMPLTDVGAKIQNATELPMMEQSDGHYVGYWTAPKGTVAKGAVIEVKAVDSFKNETRKTAAGKLYINVKSNSKGK